MELTQHNIIDYFLARYPSLREKYLAYVIYFKTPIPRPVKDSFWEVEEEEEHYEEPTFCAQLMSLEYSISALMKTEGGDEEIVKKIFNDIEEILAQCTDPFIEKDFEICFFENLLNGLSQRDYPIARLSQLLGPVSLKLCKDNEKFWGSHMLEC